MDPLLTLQRLARACALNDSDLSALLADLGLENPPTTSTDTIGGRPVRLIQTGLVNPSDATIPIGAWKLRLVPTPTGTPGDTRVPITLVCHTDDASFRELRVELARFELEADPDHLVAADLHTDPHIHLTPTEPPVPGESIAVRLLGPGVTFIIRGVELDDFDLEITGAVGGSDAAFPSARFEPPHFLIGGTDGRIGVLCDEVLLDLKRDDNPSVVDDRLPGVDNTWRGLILKELGVLFHGSGDQSSWAGTFAMQNFFIGLDPIDLSGTFIAELVHFVLENDPQVQVTISFEDETGQEVEAASEGDASIPAPPAGRDYARVRLRAQPNWDSAGFRVRWSAPTGVSVEEPLRRSRLDLGWVQVPPGEHDFTVVVTDHRVDTQTETRRVVVASPPVDAPGAPPITAVFDGVLEDAGFEAGQRPTNRVHMTLRPGQRTTITARAAGQPSSVNAQLSEEPAGFFSFISSTPQPDNLLQNLVKQPGSNEYELAQWVIAAPETPPAADAVLILRVTGVVNETTGETANIFRRLRIRVEDAPPDGHRDFELVSYTDWRAEPGIGLARLRLLNGMNMQDIIWTLDRKEIDLSLFSDAAHDSLFNGGTFDAAEPLTLSNSAGTVRPFLHSANQLWRLTGSVSPAAVGVPRAPIAIGETNPAALGDQAVRDFLGSVPSALAYSRADGVTVRTILFRYDCDEIQPEAGTCTTTGPEHASLRLPPGDTDAEQAKGFAALFRAIEEYGDQIEAIGLFGAASIEGSLSYNLDLSQRRAEAARDALVSPPARLLSALAALPAPDQLTSIPSEVTTRIADLNTAGMIAVDAFGEAHSREIPVNGGFSPDPQDRRVFAVLRLAPAASSEEIVHREYFVTLPGAPPPAETPETPEPNLQEHPFRHSIFRLAHVEVELLHNELIRLQIRLKLDLEAFNENDVLPGGDLNTLDGITTIFLEMRENTNPAPGEASVTWEAAVLADPGDVDGFQVWKRPEHDTHLDISGPPAVVTPALTALTGGRIGITAFLGGLATGYLLAELGVLDANMLIWRGFRLFVLVDEADRPTIRLGVDYTLKFFVNANLSQITGIPGLPTLSNTSGNPIEVSFRNLGVEFAPGSVRVEFFYNPEEGFQLDVNDPGTFRLGDGIGRLLNVDRFRGGAGSPLWFETELSLALETGIFSVDTLRIRASLDMEKLFEPDGGAVTLGEGNLTVEDLDVSINKLGVSVDIPSVLEGRGEFGFSGSAIEGQIDLSLIPLDLRIYGGLKVFEEDEFRALFAQLGVDFAPGIPLFSTGLAIYGFYGLVGVNMERSSPQPLPWFAAPPVGVTDTNKWSPRRGNWAFGVGTVLGTAYDDGFSFNTKGAFVLEIPGPKFLLATESKFVAQKPAVGSAARGDLLSVIMLDLENDLLLIGMDFTFEREPLIEFRVPTEAFFNLARSDDWYIRFGLWEPASKRITLRLLTIWDAWGYFVLDSDGSRIPGPLDLQGISLASGARIEVFWGSRDLGVYLEAFVEYHAGLQIKPLLVQGTLEVGGELHLAVVSFGARGRLRIIAPDPFVVQGEICGGIDLWLFSIEGCASFTIGDEDAPVPDPPNPFTGLAVIDRMTSAEVEDPNRAPLDCVLHLLFDQDVIDERVPPGLNLADPGSLRNQVSGDLYYEFYLDGARIIRVSDGTPLADFQSAWGPYSLPGATPEEADSARTLRLLDWVPSSHPRALDFSGGYGETIRVLIERLCDPTPPPDRDCATFDEEPLGVRSFWRLDEGELEPVLVISTQGNGLGAEVMGAERAFSAARVVPLVPVLYPDRAPARHCLRLPAVLRPRQQLDLRDLVARLKDLLFEASPELGDVWLGGLLFIRLPNLVQADATFVLPERLQRDGQAVFLDEDFQPVSEIFSLQAAPVVPGSSGSGAFSAYVARRVAFGPPEDTDEPPRAAWLLVNPPGPNLEGGRDFRYSFLNEICGISYGEWLRWREREGSKQQAIAELQSLTGIIGGVPAVSDQELLEPNTVYRVEGDLRWARFRHPDGAETDGDDSFPDISITFRTAANAPTDIRRYIQAFDPPDDEQPHYYEEPTRVIFASDVVDKLFAKFGLQLVARAKADTGQHTLNQPMSAGLEREFFPFGSFEETLFDALTGLEGRCLPGDWEHLFPKPVYTFPEPLSPNTGYTITLIPRPLGEPTGLEPEVWDALLQSDFDNNRQVFRFDIRTSRWGIFSAHVDAYRSAPTGDLIAADEAVLDAALAAISGNRSDEAVDALSQAMFGGPLAIPAAPQVIRIWATSGSAPDPFSPPPYRCRAILLDGPETLLKRRPDGSPRVALEARQTSSASDPFSAGTPLPGLRIIAGARGGRVFVTFAASAPVPVVQIEIRDQANPSDPPVREHLVIPVGDTPGSFDEGGA